MIKQSRLWYCIIAMLLPWAMSFSQKDAKRFEKIKTRDDHEAFIIKFNDSPYAKKAYSNLDKIIYSEYELESYTKFIESSQTRFGITPSEEQYRRIAELEEVERGNIVNSKDLSRKFSLNDEGLYMAIYRDSYYPEGMDYTKSERVWFYMFHDKSRDDSGYKRFSLGTTDGSIGRIVIPPKDYLPIISKNQDLTTIEYLMLFIGYRDGPVSYLHDAMAGTHDLIDQLPNLREITICFENYATKEDMDMRDKFLGALVLGRDITLFINQGPLTKYSLLKDCRKIFVDREYRLLKTMPEGSN